MSKSYYDLHRGYHEKRVCIYLPRPLPPPLHVLNCLKMDSQLSFTMNANSVTVPRKVVTGGEGRQAPSLKMTLVHLFCFSSQTGQRHFWPVGALVWFWISLFLCTDITIVQVDT